MTIVFFGTHARWNLRNNPSIVSKERQNITAIHKYTLERAKYTIVLPIGDMYDEICIVPDTDDESVTYGRLFDALHEYYNDDTARIDALGEFTEYGGIIAYTTPLTYSTKLLLNLEKECS